MCVYYIVFVFLFCFFKGVSFKMMTSSCYLFFKDRFSVGSLTRFCLLLVSYPGAKCSLHIMNGIGSGGCFVHSTYLSYKSGLFFRGSSFMSFKTLEITIT